MKSVWTFFLFTVLAFSGYSQKGTEDEIFQIRKIVEAADKNFATLRTGEGKKADTNLQYGSNIKIKNTGDHSISIASDKKSATYIIPVSDSPTKEQTGALYKRWSKFIVAAIGNSFKRSCSPINLGDIARGEQCDYVIKKNGYTITLTLANIYSAETESSSLDLFIRKD